MAPRSLVVLMWKHGMVRMRKYFHTAVEFLSPLPLFILLFCLKDIMNPPRPDYMSRNANQVHNTEAIELGNLQGLPHPILYYPETPNTKLLMDTVGKQLDWNRQETFPGFSNLFDRRPDNYYYGSENLTVLYDFLKMNRHAAVIVFQDMEGDVLPDKLKYSVRLKDKILTHFQPSTLGPHSQFGRDYEPFMRLQWIIDTSFIQLKADNYVAPDLLVQEFPYYTEEEYAPVELVGQVVKNLTCPCLFLMFVFLVGRLLAERTTGIQELIKMVGVSVHTLGLSHFLNVLPTGLVFSAGATILLKASSRPLIANSSGFMIFLMLFLYFVTVVSVAFVCSYLAKNSQYATAIASVVFITLWLGAERLTSATCARPLQVLSGLLPHVPMYWFWTELTTLEKFGTGLYWSTMWKAHSDKSQAAFVTYMFLLVQSALYFFLAWYLSLVRPGQYGQALPWNFLCQPQYWSKNEVKPQMDSEEEEYIAKDPRYFENPPIDGEVGIRVANVSKVFPKQTALKNVSLDVYKGEITVLLGHNGAGKTTLMSIITGMYSASEGKVYVNGKDTETQLSEVRKQIGLCPQHNLFFPDLTVLEHLIFFTLLKRGTYKEARAASLQLVKQLGLREKAGVLCDVLSGGMRRRTQLACALAGGADLLVLDEPTSGLDVETRRELWDLLLSLRGSRTVLLTTHFMEEADALGDRVAALHAGRLRCLATPMHLKKAIGTGYRLTFTTLGAPKEMQIASVVTSHIPEATIREKTINSISYNLPAVASDKFPALFTALEAKRSGLGIESIGVGVSTLEEVFLKLCSDVDTMTMDDETDTAMIDPTFNRLTGPRLYLRQMWVLLKRQMRYIIFRKWSFLIMQFLLPVLIMFALAHAFNDTHIETDDRLAMDLDIYNTIRDKRVMYSVGGPHEPVQKLAAAHKDVRFEPVDDVSEAILQSGKENIFEYNKYIAGFEYNETNAKVLYTTTVRYAAPVAMNLLTNMLAARYIPEVDGQTITTVNYPMPLDYEMMMDIVQPKDFAVALFWIISIVFVVLVTYVNMVSLPCKERLSGARHLHVMSGCPAELYWGATLLAHAAIGAVCLLLPAVLAPLVLDTDHTFDNPTFLGTLAIIIFLGTLAFCSVMYLMSFHFGERGAGIMLTAVVFIFGVITPIMKGTVLVITDEPKHGVLYYFLEICNVLAPPHTFVIAGSKASYVARLEAMCSLNKDRCPNMGIPDIVFDEAKCCAGKPQSCYLCLEKNTPGTEMLLLLMQFFIYMTLVILQERGVMSYVYDRIFNSSYRPVPPTDVTENVRAEETYVSSAIKLPKTQIPDAMLVDSVHKRYPQLFKKSCNAVQGLSFSVKKGECFGLLGVNGAGKSTTFKLLTAEHFPTRGGIYANGQHLSLCNSKYLQTLGYCPQFFGLDEFLTGSENLKLLLTLRGHEANDVREEVDSWIKLVGLQKYSGRAVAGYSGGCARRLAAAAALCAGAELTLLDEPTAGVDVAARRRVWAALRRGLRNNRSVVITSHSMDEMEALCSRIGIMSAGRMRALGSAAALRAAHAQGHAVVFKLRHATLAALRDEVDNVKSKTSLLKGRLHERFNCTLKDEHKTMLHYHINETMRYSDLFQQLEALKEEFGALIEDYSVTETTLEEVFLSFAKADGPTDV